MDLGGAVQADHEKVQPRGHQPVGVLGQGRPVGDQAHDKTPGLQPLYDLPDVGVEQRLAAPDVDKRPPGRYLLGHAGVVLSRALAGLKLGAGLSQVVAALAPLGAHAAAKVAPVGYLDVQLEGRPEAPAAAEPEVQVGRDLAAEGGPGHARQKVRPGGQHLVEDGPGEVVHHSPPGGWCLAP